MNWHKKITGWHKASASDRDFENCVEVGTAPGVAGIRDTKQRELPDETRPVLVFDRETFDTFVQHVS